MVDIPNEPALGKNTDGIESFRAWSGLRHRGGERLLGLDGRGGGAQVSPVLEDLAVSLPLRRDGDRHREPARLGGVERVSRVHDGAVPRPEGGDAEGSDRGRVRALDRDRPGESAGALGGRVRLR